MIWKLEAIRDVNARPGLSHFKIEVVALFLFSVAISEVNVELMLVGHERVGCSGVLYRLILHI